MPIAMPDIAKRTAKRDCNIDPGAETSTSANT